MKNIINYKGNDMKKNKLILFDWGNIVESYTTGYTIHDAFDDLFRIVRYIVNYPNTICQKSLV